MKRTGAILILLAGILVAQAQSETLITFYENGVNRQHKVDR